MAWQKRQARAGSLRFRGEVYVVPAGAHGMVWFHADPAWVEGTMDRLVLYREPRTADGALLCVAWLSRDPLVSR